MRSAEQSAPEPAQSERHAIAQVWREASNGLPRAPSACVAAALPLRSEGAGTIKLVSPERDISRSVPRVVGMVSGNGQYHYEEDDS